MATLEEKIRLEEERDVEEARLPRPGETEEQQLARAGTLEEASSREAELQIEAAMGTARMILSLDSSEELVNKFRRAVFCRTGVHATGERRAAPESRRNCRTRH